MIMAVIRLRGSVRTSEDTAYALQSLNLTRVNHCSLVKKSDNIKSSLNRVKDYTTYGEINEETLKELIQKRGRKTGDERLSEQEASKVLEGIKQGKSPRTLGIKPVFRLRPPRKGLKSKKSHFPKGDLGFRGDKINELIKRMI